MLGICWEVAEYAVSYNYMLVIRAIINHKPKIERFSHPMAFIPTELERPSGMLDIETVITVATLTGPPPIMVRPIAIDSGIPIQ